MVNNLLIVSTFLVLSVFSSSIFASNKLDVNGDGQADILWRNQVTGQNWLWTMNGTQVLQSKGLNNISLDWDIAGRGDFNGDGKSDILWRNNKTGRNWIYLLDGFSIITSKELNYISDLSWQIKGVQDLNGDGKDDILWRHAVSGRTWIYIMNGTSITTSKGSQTVTDLGWKIVGSGDVNGDNRDDIIWRHKNSGTNYIWLMNNTNIQNQFVLNTVASAWEIIGLGDLNGDNTDDILWRNKDDGRNWAYLMSNGSISLSKQINSIADQNWHIRTIGDLDGDGKQDIFWRNQETGQTYVYLMNGVSIISRGWSTTIGLDWEVISSSTKDRVTIIADDCANNSSTACSLAINSSGNGVIEKSGDGDVFIVNITEAGSLTVYSTGTTDVNGGLFEQGNGSALLQDDNSGTGNNFSLTWQVTPKKYYVQVKGEVGSYNLITEFSPDTNIDPLTYYQENISQQVVQAKCIVCHIANGAAGASRLHFVNSNTPNYQAINSQAFADFLTETGVESDYILSKAQGSLAHGGAQQLTFGSDEYNALAEYLGLLTGLGDDTSTDDIWSGVGLLSHKQTLRKAALIFAGRLPSKSEYEAISDNTEASLKTALKNLMTGDGFHKFLTEAANDRLLTFKYLQRGADFLDLNNGHVIEGAILQYEANLAGQADDFWRNVLDPAQEGFARSATELIAYVVENEKPYTEILTADYMMLNPQLNKLFRGDGEFVDENDDNEYVPAKFKGYMLFDDSYDSEFVQDFGLNVKQEGTVLEWPHSGILNDPAFLQRYPSTATNRNRARSRWTQYLFLDFDIEKSAARTNDPEALADRNNPTMNNPFCTVCHIPMDPIAGAFQDYGDSGFFKDSWGGKDSLADSYKWPDDGNSPYQEGDTWYRGMRSPGYYGEDAPLGQDSLTWLAQKIISDDRFAISTIKFWWLGIFGALPADAPENASDEGFEENLTIYNQQSAFINLLADSLRQDWNLKNSFVDIIMSPWFRANAMSEELQTLHNSSNAGVGQLLSPFRFENKMFALSGKKWGEYYNDWNQNYVTKFSDEYRLVFGGIDSDGIVKRAEEVNSIMAQVALTHAAEMSCGIVLEDFVRADNERKLFSGFDKNMLPSFIGGTETTLSGVYYENYSTNSVEINLPVGSNSIVLINEHNDYQEDDGFDVDINMSFIEVKIVNASNNDVIAIFDAQSMYDHNASSVNGNVETWQSQEAGVLVTYNSTSFALPVEIVTQGEYRVEVSGYTDIWTNGGDDYTNAKIAELGGQTIQVTAQANDVLKSNSATNQLYRTKIAQLIFDFWGEEVANNSVEVDMALALFEESRKAKLLRSTWQHIQEQNSSCDFDYGAYNTDTEDGWRMGNDPRYVMSAWRTVVTYLMTDYKFLHE